MAADPPPETIYFFRRSHREVAGRWAGRYSFFSLCFAAWIIASVFGACLARLSGFRGFAGMMTVQIILVALVGWRAVLWIKVRRSLNDLPEESSSKGARLTCVGVPGRLAQFGEFADVPFEPAFCSATFVQPFSKTMSWIAVAWGLLLIVAFHFILNYLGGWALSDWHAAYPAKCYGGIAAGVIIVGWLWPTHFRIVPGRLDVLRFNNILNRPVEAEHHDLRKARILVDLRRGVVFIDHEDGRSVELPIRWMRGRERFAYYLFLAAMSSYEAPPLPDDKLLG